MPLTYPYQQYQGVWTLSQASDAVAQGKWPSPPAPHLYSWGLNIYGQLGLGNTTNYSSPKQIGSLTNWSNIQSGYYDSFAITTSGNLYSWGVGNSGCLGLGNTNIQYSSPKQVGSLTNWSSVYAGNTGPSTFAIKTDGTLWAWGYNLQGQLGLGNTTPYSSPKQVGALTNWSKLNLGYDHTLAVKTDGTLWAWGANTHGQLGLGNTTYFSSPKQIGALTNWSNVSCGVYYTLATKTDGTLWGWGYNNYGQLGLNNTTQYSSPKQVGALTNWLTVAAGAYSTFAIKTDGSIWSWGSGSSGCLGFGNTTNYSSPKQIGSLTNWSTVVINFLGNSPFSIKTDGTLWGWGSNNYGLLGLGDITNRSSPTQIGALTTWLSISANYNSTLAIAKT